MDKRNTEPFDSQKRLAHGDTAENSKGHDKQFGLRIAKFGL
jgi:hypothetical protein